MQKLVADTERLPDTWDNSMLTEFRTCMTRGYWRYIRGLQPEGGNLAADAGNVIHTGLAEWYAGKGLQAALEAAEQEYASRFGHLLDRQSPSTLVDVGLDIPAQYMLEYLLETLERYCKEDPLQWIGEPTAVEQPFRHPIGDTGLYYGGRIDLILRRPDNSLVVIDHKTTSMMGKLALERVHPSSQLFGYVWATAHRDHTIYQVMHNLIALYKSGKPASFQPTPIVTCTDFELGEWFYEVCWVLKAVIECYQRRRWPRNYAACYAFFGRCPYLQLCNMRQPVDQILMPAGYVVADPWEPWKPTDRQREKAVATEFWVNTDCSRTPIKGEN